MCGGFYLSPPHILLILEVGKRFVILSAMDSTNTTTAEDLNQAEAFGRSLIAASPIYKTAFVPAGSPQTAPAAQGMPPQQATQPGIDPVTGQPQEPMIQIPQSEWTAAQNRVQELEQQLAAAQAAGAAAPIPLTQ